MIKWIKRWFKAQAGPKGKYCPSELQPHPAPCRYCQDGNYARCENLVVFDCRTRLGEEKDNEN